MGWKSAVMSLAVVLMLPVGVLAADAQCSSEHAQEFDFWIGEWDVYEDGKLAGHNTIEPILDGCVLQESWRGVEGSAGSSLNFYNPQTGKWQQFWVWRRGTTLELEGGLEGARMVLSGSTTGREGETLLNRISWTPNSDGSVRQHWEASKDGGESWGTVFDGRYRKRGSATRPATRPAETRRD